MINKLQRLLDAKTIYEMSSVLNEDIESPEEEALRQLAEGNEDERFAERAERDAELEKFN